MPLGDSDVPPRRLTPNQTTALWLLREYGGVVQIRRGVWAHEGVITSGATMLYDGEPWINGRTAHALRVRGLVVFDDGGEYVYLVRGGSNA